MAGAVKSTITFVRTEETASPKFSILFCPINRARLSSSDGHPGNLVFDCRPPRTPIFGFVKFSPSMLRICSLRCFFATRKLGLIEQNYMNWTSASHLARRQYKYSGKNKTRRDSFHLRPNRDSTPTKYNLLHQSAVNPHLHFSPLPKMPKKNTTRCDSSILTALLLHYWNTGTHSNAASISNRYAGLIIYRITVPPPRSPV